LLVAISLAVPLLAQEAETAEFKDRLRIARDAIRAGPDGIARLTPLTKDPDPLIRVEAVRSMAEIGSQYSLTPLTQALADSDPEVQIRATDGLVNFYVPGYGKTALSSSIRRTGDAVSGRFRQETEPRVIDPWIEARPEIATALAKVLRDSPDLLVRANAARALGVLRGRDAVPDLHAALRSKDTTLMYESLVALEKIRDPRSGPAVRFLFRDPEEKIAVAAIETAGLVRSAETLPEMEAVYDRASSVRVRRAALNAMAAIAQMESRQRFVAALGENDEYLRAAALEGLGRLKVPTDMPSVDATFSSERRARPKLAAAFALVNNGRVELGEGGPLSYLISSLNSRAWSGIAEPYLIELSRAKNVRTVLERTLPTASKNEKVALARVLAYSGDRDTITALERLSRDSDPAVMEEAIRGLRTLKARIP
jgi:HEAT repeat protein